MTAGNGSTPSAASSRCDIPLTISVLPDVRYTGVVAREASNAGKGVMLHLPMETVSGMNPGPGKVTTEMSDPQIAAQVEDDLAQVPLARGVNNHEGSKASADERVMRDVIGVLAEKRRPLLHRLAHQRRFGGADDRAVAGRADSASRDVFLDNRADVAYSEASSWKPRRSRGGRGRRSPSGIRARRRSKRCAR